MHDDRLRSQSNYLRENENLALKKLLAIPEIGKKRQREKQNPEQIEILEPPTKKVKLDTNALPSFLPPAPTEITVMTQVGTEKTAIE